MNKLCLFLCLFLAPLAATAKNPALIGVETGVVNPAPAELSLDSYQAWADSLLRPGDGRDFVSAFTPLVFEWRAEQEGRDLPPEVYRDEGRIYVDVQRPLRQTIELEEAGEIEEGNTVGAEVYAEMDGTVAEALEAMLFLWGKPVGELEGRSYPNPSPFGRRVEYFAPNPEWGDRAYANVTLRRNGGIVKDLSDRYLLLVRGNEADGYTVLMQYIRPARKTETQQVFALAMLTPLANGKVAYRISTRYQGQNYKILGSIGIGRSQIGFNPRKVRDAAEEFRARIDELRRTGTIRDRDSDLVWE